MSSLYHIPAMPVETMRFLDPQGSGVWVDCTLGGGGHAGLICQRLNEDAVYIGLDRDPKALEAAQKSLQNQKCRVVLRQVHFSKVGEVLREMDLKADGFLWDLGLSSSQIDRGEGFSINDLGSALDMRQDPDQELHAGVVLNTYAEKELADLIYGNSDERFSRRIAAAIVKARPLATVGDLANAVRGSLPRGFRKSDDVLRRVCQAVRMEVNREIPELVESLEEALKESRQGCRFVTLAYHSGEDRIVKRFFRQMKVEGKLKILTPTPLRPGISEIRVNPRARPARLRAAEVIQV